jgi:hypothetical protein
MSTEHATKDIRSDIGDELYLCKEIRKLPPNTRKQSDRCAHEIIAILVRHRSACGG